MKKGLILGIVITLVFGLTLTGCGAKKAESSKEAISVAKTMETTEQKVNYLVGQAKSFYNSKEFQGAVDIAQYILRYLDSDSQQEALSSKVKGAVEDAKKGLSGFGK